MTKRILAFIIAFFIYSSLTLANEKESITIPLGVYAVKTGYSTIIIELKADKYRFWFSSDAKVSSEEIKYPISGKYTKNENKISLQGVDKYHNIWFYKTLTGKPTLWSSRAVEYWNKEKRFEHSGILFKTDKQIETLWKQ